MYFVKQSSTLGVNLTNLKIGRSVVTMHFSKTNLKICDRGLQFRKKTYDLHATEIIAEIRNHPGPTRAAGFIAG